MEHAREHKEDSMQRPIFMAITLLGCMAGSLGCDSRQEVPVAPSAGGPGVVFATIDVKCPGGGTFTVSTGTKAGTCSAIYSNGQVRTASCQDGGNTSNLNCDRQSACTSSTGAGTCTVKQ
jgi:hypothetical protein